AMRSSPRPRHERQPSSAAPSPARAPAAVAAGAFDFNKPYEPAVKDAAAPAAELPPLGHRRKPARPTAALLGGFPSHQKSEK
ncbi:MAG TPA: hypothetical protein VLT92_17490, partial [Burkholderiales bacterium]|nr:hypothetical protein [Burkholderiales bacterium]